MSDVKAVVGPYVTQSELEAAIVEYAGQAVDPAVAAAEAARDAAQLAETGATEKAQEASDDADLAQAWAESPTAPGGAGTKSSKTHATEAGASAFTATTKAAEAVIAAEGTNEQAATIGLQKSAKGWAQTVAFEAVLNPATTLTAPTSKAVANYVSTREVILGLFQKELFLKADSFWQTGTVSSVGGINPSTTRLITTSLIEIVENIDITINRFSPQYLVNIAFYQEDNTYIGATSWIPTYPSVVSPPSLAAKVRFLIKHPNDSTITVLGSSDRDFSITQGQSSDATKRKEFTESVLTGAYRYTNVTYSNGGAISSASVVYPNGIAGSIGDFVTDADGKILSATYTMGDLTLQYTVNYNESGFAVSNNLTLLPSI